MAAVYRSSRGQALVHLLLLVWRGNPVWREVLLLLRLLADASFRSVGHGYLDTGTGEPAEAPQSEHASIFSLLQQLDLARPFSARNAASRALPHYCLARARRYGRGLSR